MKKYMSLLTLFIFLGCSDSNNEFDKNTTSIEFVRRDCKDLAELLHANYGLEESNKNTPVCSIKYKTREEAFYGHEIHGALMSLRLEYDLPRIDAFNECYKALDCKKQKDPYPCAVKCMKKTGYRKYDYEEE